MTDPYRVLGVGSGATRDEVRAAYRRLARRWHPDFHTTATREIRDEAERRMKALNAAYDEIVSGRAVAARTISYEAYRRSPSWAATFRETVRSDGDRLADWYAGAGPTVMETLRELRDIVLGRPSPPLTVEQVARRLRTSPRAVVRLIEKGVLRAQVVAGGAVRISADALAGYLYGRGVVQEGERAK